MDLDQTQAISFDEDVYENQQDKKIIGYLKVLDHKGFYETCFPLYDGDNIVGREESSNICIPIKAISKQHACIETNGGNCFIYDMASKNKTRRGKTFLVPQVRYEMRLGEEYIFGDVRCVYLQTDQPESDKLNGAETGSETGSESMLPRAPLTNGADTMPIQAEPASCTDGPHTEETNTVTQASEETDITIEQDDSDSEPLVDLFQPTQKYGEDSSQEDLPVVEREGGGLVDHSFNGVTTNESGGCGVLVHESPANCRASHSFRADDSGLIAPTQAYVMESDAEDADDDDLSETKETGIEKCTDRIDTEALGDTKHPGQLANESSTCLRLCIDTTLDTTDYETQIFNEAPALFVDATPSPVGPPQRINYDDIVPPMLRLSPMRLVDPETRSGRLSMRVLDDTDIKKLLVDDVPDEMADTQVFCEGDTVDVSAIAPPCQTSHVTESETNTVGHINKTPGLTNTQTGDSGSVVVELQPTMLLDSTQVSDGDLLHGPASDLVADMRLQSTQMFSDELPTKTHDELCAQIQANEVTQVIDSTRVKEPIHVYDSTQVIDTPQVHIASAQVLEQNPDQFNEIDEAQDQDVVSAQVQSIPCVQDKDALPCIIQSTQVYDSESVDIQNSTRVHGGDQSSDTDVSCTQTVVDNVLKPTIMVTEVESTKSFGEIETHGNIETIHAHGEIETSQAYVEIEPTQAEIKPTQEYGELKSTQAYCEIEPTQAYGEIEPIQACGEIEHIQAYGKIEPTQGEIKPTQAYGKIEPTQAYGEIEPTQAYGEIEPTQGEIKPTQEHGELKSTQAYCEIEPTQAYGKIEPTQACGEIEHIQAYGKIEPTQGEIKPTQAYGEIETTQAYGEIEPTQAYGEIEPTQAYGEIEPTQAYGEIELTQGEIKPTQEYGELKPTQAYCEIEPTQAYGEIDHTQGEIKPTQGYSELKPTQAHDEIEPTQAYGEIDATQGEIKLTQEYGEMKPTQAYCDAQSTSHTGQNNSDIIDENMFDKQSKVCVVKPRILMENDDQALKAGESDDHMIVNDTGLAPRGSRKCRSMLLVQDTKDVRKGRSSRRSVQTTLSEQDAGPKGSSAAGRRGKKNDAPATFTKSKPGRQSARLKTGDITVRDEEVDAISPVSDSSTAAKCYEEFIIKKIPSSDNVADKNTNDVLIARSRKSATALTSVQGISEDEEHAADNTRIPSSRLKRQTRMNNVIQAVDSKGRDKLDLLPSISEDTTDSTVAQTRRGSMTHSIPEPVISNDSNKSSKAKPLPKGTHNSQTNKDNTRKSKDRIMEDASKSLNDDGEKSSEVSTVSGRSKRSANRVAASTEADDNPSSVPAKCADIDDLPRSRSRSRRGLIKTAKEVDAKDPSIKEATGKATSRSRHKNDACSTISVDDHIGENGKLTKTAALGTVETSSEEYCCDKLESNGLRTQSVKGIDKGSKMSRKTKNSDPVDEVSFVKLENHCNEDEDDAFKQPNDKSVGSRRQSVRGKTCVNKALSNITGGARQKKGLSAIKTEVEDSTDEHDGPSVSPRLSVIGTQLANGKKTSTAVKTEPAGRSRRHPLSTVVGDTTRSGGDDAENISVFESDSKQVVGRGKRVASRSTVKIEVQDTPVAKKVKDVEDTIILTKVENTVNINRVEHMLNDSPVNERKRKSQVNEEVGNSNTPPMKTSRRRSTLTSVDELSSPGHCTREVPSTKYKVLFTGVVDDSGQKIVSDLGGETAVGVCECTHLVTDKVRRTVKFLCCVARGVPIVTASWLSRCRTAKMFVDHSSCLVQDKETEKQWGFKLQESLTRASNRPLFAGYRVHVTKSVRPEPSEMKDILQCAGAEYVTTMPRKVVEQTLVISCEDDKALCKNVVSMGIPVVSAEFVLTGVLKQLVTTDSFRLFVEPATKTTQSRSKRKR